MGTALCVVPFVYYVDACCGDTVGVAGAVTWRVGYVGVLVLRNFCGKWCEIWSLRPNFKKSGEFGCNFAVKTKTITIMTHSEFKFENLSQVLSRCGEKVANEAISEIRAAINQAVAEGTTADEVDTLLTPMQSTITAAQTARKQKAAARRAARKAAKSEAEAPDDRFGSCGEAEAELPATSPSPSGEGWGEATPATYFTAEMVTYLRRCPEAYMLSVLNSYFHLIITGNLVDTVDDHRFLDNFIYLTRTMGLIENDLPATAEQAAAFLFDNPALPLPRAERRRLERMRRKLHFAKK